MCALKCQLHFFDSNNNPFLKANNPYRITQKFYTQKHFQGNFHVCSKNHNNPCNHCVKNAPLIDELNKRSNYLKEEKQNLQKVLSSKFKGMKLTQNPFEQKRLMCYDVDSFKSQETHYSRKDQNKLRQLVQNNPFKKYQQEKQNFEHINQMDVRFHEIKIQLNQSQSKGDPIRKENTPKLNIVNQERKVLKKVSIDSFNKNSQRRNSIQNQLAIRSRFSPTFAQIATNRQSYQSKNKIIEQNSFESKRNGLMQQICQSRKQFSQWNTRREIQQMGKQIQDQDSQNLSSKKSLHQKQIKKDPSDFITIKGKTFFLNKVHLKY